MKKVLFIMATAISINTYSQANLWWKLDGSNTANSNTALGTANNEPLRFKVNGTEWLKISPTGEYYFHSLNGFTEGLLGVKTDGKLKRIDFTGNSTDVLLGNGTFGQLSSLTGWSFNGNVLYSTYNIGIGTNFAPERLTVDGNIVATGAISGTSLNVIDIVGVGKEFKISTSLCMKGKDLNDPNTRNEICGLNGDLYIQSDLNNTHNTIFSYNNGAKVGFGIIPMEKFHVGVTARFDQDIFTNKIFTNRITTNDSVIAIGDSSIYFNTIYNQIYGSSNTNMKGVALGSATFPKGLNSIAIGRRVRSDGFNSIVIGRTDVSSSNMLINTIDNSLMVGFNSDVSTLTVLPANGNGTTGQVGIGTTCVPAGYSLAVKGKIIMEEGTVKLADANGCWPDFVFEESYSKMNWESKLEYINTNKHLPYMPSAIEIDESGLDVGTGMAAITQNVEENTLDIIQLYKEIQTMKIELEKLKEENLKLKNQLEDKH